MKHDTPPPASQAWRMPAEWEPHEATWIAWPHNREDWPGKFAPIAWVFTEMVRLLHTGEKVCILVNGRAQEQRARGQLERAGVDLKQVRFFRIPTDRVWTRDSGPIFVRSSPVTTSGPLVGDNRNGCRYAAGKLGCVCWRFNAWAKYDDWKRDVTVAEKIAGKCELPVWKPTSHGQRVVLEGGSIDVNGAGLLLTTEECLLSPVQARNPGLSRGDVEKVLGEYLGIKKVLWLGNGIAGDDTHGHVDDLARFVGPSTVVTVVEDNRADPNYEALQDNLRRLAEMTDVAGKNLEVVKLPMPAPVFFAGRRLPASYANFFIGNSCVLVPTFNDPADGRALGMLADHFPGRKVIGVHARDLVWGLGTLHCMTQQQPAAEYL